MANDNDPGQVVLSGSKRAIDRAVTLSKGHGVRRAVLLDVSAPFHSALMQPAAEVMAKALAEVTIRVPAVPLVAIVVQKELWDSGALRSIKDLKGKRIGVTQIGSTFHYHIGNILEKDGLTLADVKIVPLQAMPATMEALKGKQVDAILVPQPFPGAAEAQGFGKVMAWAGDLYPWQIATIFYSGKLATDRARAVAFMKGYVKASRHYHDAALVQKDGRLAPGAGYEEVVQITARYTGARPENIRLGFPFQDRNGRLLVPDIERQMAWWTANGFMKKALPLRSIVDTSFVEEAVKALDK